MQSVETVDMGLRPRRPVTGLDVIVSKAGKIEALYTFLDPAPK